ncbi:hypothetical protein [[Mycoplasma] gypis]|uniref:hypothetical protein n=1 Tax=[Mycoplasma] gypis TaxID=92404 RepID=UPI00196744D9|nr:hypothetical protein [[Mycoplasma] gypis]MBN0919682.1 hypothetical protein [[Mycoplasma] gypis]
MEFDKYLKALYAQKDSNDLSLTGNELKEVVSYVVDKSLIGTLGTKLQISEVNTSNATILKNIGQEWHEKTTAGVTSFDKAKYNSVVVNWSKPLYQTVGFTEADKVIGVPQTAQIKLQKASSDFNDKFEAYCWKKIEEKVKAKKSQGGNYVKNLLDKSITDIDVYREVVTLATSLTKHKDDNDGINGIQKSDIVIHVKPEVLDRIAISGHVGNMSEATFVGGQYSFATVGGYKIYANQYLNEVDCLVATNFSAISMVNINAANIATLSPSNDIAFYFEAMSLFDTVYDTTFRAISKA